MGHRFVLGSLVALLAACGGHVEPTTESGDSPPLSSQEGEPGLYLSTNPGGPEHVADGLGTPTALAMANERVVFTTRTTTLSGERVEAGALYVADKRVGPALVLAVDRRGASFDALAADLTTAFVATSDGRLVSVALAGGEMKTLAVLSTPAVVVAVAGNHVYFATDAGALGRLAKAGGEVEVLATITGAIRGLEVDDAAVYVATGPGEEVPAGIVRVPLDGTKVHVLTSGGEPCAMIRDGRRLFWTTLPARETPEPSTPTTGEVLRLSLDGGDVATVASGAFTACAIASDEQNLYFATRLPSAESVASTGGRDAPAANLGIMRAPIAGGEPVAIAAAAHVLVQPGAVAVDGSHVYWLTETAVLRLRK